jgi:potassium efflux system protein
MPPSRAPKMRASSSRRSTTSATQADKFVAARTGDLADLNARLGELGNPPAAGATEDPDITRQRARLTKERNALDADIRLARLLSDRRAPARHRPGVAAAPQFEASSPSRAASPLNAATFWNDLREAWPDDLDRLQAIGLALATASRRRCSPRTARR